MFKYLYWTVGLLLYLLFLPVMFFKQRYPKYKQHIPARYFLKNNSKFTPHGLWFHGCSLGETRGLRPLIERLDGMIHMSTITCTGFAEACSIARGEVRFLPFEIFLPWWITPQKLLVVTESEYWYLLFHIARKKGAKTILVNARISDHRYDRYRRFHWFYKRVFGEIDRVFAQSEKDKKRLEALGAKQVEVTGNTKLANTPMVTHALNKPSGRVITAASTHETEEKLILNTWSRIQGRLVIVPRHPERFERVDQLIRKHIENTSLSYHRYSEHKNLDADLVLVDCMGELINIYAVSDVVILGGGFVQGIGGHNPVEPAYFNTVLITGQWIHDQVSVYDALIDYTVADKESLPVLLKNLDTLPRCRIVQQGDIEPILRYIAEEVYGEIDEK